MKFQKRYMLGLLVVMILMLTGCGKGEKYYRDALLTSSMSAYGGMDITLGDVINNKIANPSWGYKETNENGIELILSGEDENNDFWVINFSGSESQYYWTPMVTSYKNIYPHNDTYISDFLMSYFVTGEACWLEALDVYRCGSIELSKPYDVVNMCEEAYNLNLTDDQKLFIQQNENLFSIDYLLSYIPSEKIDFDTNLGEVNKNPGRYGDALIPVYNIEVANIWEYTVSEGEYITEIIGTDKNYDHIYTILYCGCLDGIYEEDTISTIALPLGRGTLTNAFGGETNSTVLLACIVSHSSDNQYVKDQILDAETRYSYALDYVEFVREQNALTDQMIEDGTIDMDFDYADFAIEQGYDDDTYSLSWKRGFGVGYQDAEMQYEYNDDYSMYYDEGTINAEDYRAGYEAGYINSRYSQETH